MYLRFLGFFIVNISHNCNVLFSSIILLKDRRFKAGLTPFASNEASKNILRSPENI